MPLTTLWWLDGDEYLGRLAIRHRLTPRLTDLGGHIGYDVRPSARRRGHATAMLAAALPLARALGIGPALVTCDESDMGSRLVIEANGGVLEDKRGTELRFWVPTGPGPRRRGGAARSAHLGQDLGGDQLQMVQVMQVPHLEVDPGDAQPGERPDPVHDLVGGADQPVGALRGQIPADRRGPAGQLGLVPPQQTVWAAE